MQMTQTTSERNPFMLMIAPEVILAAVEKSERLGQLNRHLCRPLDRPVPTVGQPAARLVDDDDKDDLVDGAADPVRS
ncbi:MAG: hypothetical protein KIS83_17855 [Rubrivivax sp.]|nr:hypothetical protein [Rubrivivax sp.]